MNAENITSFKGRMLTPRVPNHMTLYMQSCPIYASEFLKIEKWCSQFRLQTPREVVDVRCYSGSWGQDLKQNEVKGEKIIWIVQV